MSEIKRVKIGSIIESQIPEFLSVESPLLVEFLEQYYKSLEHQSGSIDIISNIVKYKNAKKFNNIDLIEETTLTSDILRFDQSISVTSTKGWPDSYGLLKINDEIITYISKTNTTFEGCIRGFSGIENLRALDNPEFAVFSSTQSSEHSSGDIVQNLSNLFLIEFFEKFKYEFLPGFESRDFYENISIENISYKIKDLYSSKGTDQSYKLLFKVLYGSDIEIIKPQEFTLSPSSNSYFITKNILVEKISGGNPIDIKGNFLFQNISGIGTVSASIFNVEYRPVANKNFYEVSLDSTSFSGSFEVSGKTRILEDVSVNSNSILVDSTVGFANSGSLLVKPENSDYITINYSGKTINQFTGVENVTKPLNFGLDLVEEKFAFSYIGVGNTSKVEFRVVNVIDSIDFSKTSNLRVGDTISLSGFGRDLYNEYEFNSWIYNLPTNHNIDIISQVDATKYRIELFDKIYFYNGEPILLINSNGESLEVKVISIEYSPSDVIKKYSKKVLVQVLNSGSFDVLSSVGIRKKIYKVNHYNDYFDNLNTIPAGVQNTYIDAEEKYFYVTSSGLPNYTIFSTDNKKNISTNVGVSVTDTFNVVQHDFLSGELVYYQPETSSGILTGLYYVTKVDNNKLKLSYSKSDVFSKKYIRTTSSITNDILYKSGYQNKTLNHQKLLKKFPFNRTKSIFDDLNERTTFNREIGLLINGVELLSPTLFDENIYYGSITSIDVTNIGEDYDVIDVPPIEIRDDSGSGVKAHVNLSGTVREIKILSAGYGYQEKPKITITGGNGRGCVLESNFVNTQVSVGFKADLNVTPANNTIQFLTSTPFEDGEEVIYDSNKNSNLPGIIDSSIYFVGILTDNKIKLFNTRVDALQKTNEIDIVGVSSGFHFIRTLKNKNTFTKIYVKDPGEGYSNRKVKVPSILSGDNRTSGINTFDSYIFAKNHGFSDGEYVIYNSSDTLISGLSSSIYYKVKIIDDNKFRLYNSGVSTNLSDENYTKNKFVKFNSLGIGTHTIGYPPIQINVESKSAIGSTTIIQTDLKPIVLGSIQDVYIEDGGIGYGCTNIINYHRRPNVGIASITSEAILKPIIIGGSIVDVQIIGRGNGFRTNSEIIISGKGNYAQLEPIVENGKLTAVNIVFGGVGYDPANTTLTLKNRGRNAKFLANINEWKINQVLKSKNIISNQDDGITHVSKNPELGLQFINFYVPKKLRFQLTDNFGEDNKENTGILNHSPILGYAYDGNPIYGPYAYDTTTGGFIRRMNSSYILNVDLSPGKRPPLFENGFFVNDYVYDGSGDLDQHNGRFAITPEYPNGIYAYFSTIDVNASNESVPKYPYVVGPYFYNKPVKENFLPSFNQNFDIFDTNLTRNVGPYYLNATNSYYELIDKVLEEYKQEFTVTSINSGKIEDVSIFSSGDNYKVNDPVEIDITDTGGIQSNIVVSELDGREIKDFSLIEDTIHNLEFFIRKPNTIVKTTSPHGIKNSQPILISGISTITSSGFEGIQYVQVDDKESQLMESVDTAAATGISTFIKIKDINGFKVNDFIGIGTEVLLITDIDFKRSGFYVNRLQNTGIHTAGIDNVVLLPREFKIETKDVKDSTFQNYTTFFDPRFSVGIGTSGSTRTVVGLGTSSFESRFIPPRSIYLPGHKFYTGQPLIYNSGSGFAGTSLYVNNVGSAVSFKLQDNQLVYAVNLGRDYIGLSTIGFTSSIGIGTNNKSLEFWDQEKSYGVIGAAHSLTTLNPRITGTLQKTIGVVTTTSNHNLEIGDIIKFNVSTEYNEVVKVIFDPVNRKILMREIQFSDSDVSVLNNSIDLSSYDGNINTGDKVVYIAQSPIGGLSNYGIYYVSKTSFNSIKLCQYRSDINESNFIDFSSVGGSTQKLYFINPQISCIRTTKIEFDLSDSSLSNLNLQFYYDVNFIERINERSGFFVSRSGIPGNSEAKVILDLSEQFFPIYYQFLPQGSSDESKKQISTDFDVISNNKISIINHKLNDNFVVTTIPSSKTFIFDNTKKLTEIEKQIINQSLTNFSYKTTSTNALGPISKLKINFSGRGYKKLPTVKKVKSQFGTNAIVKVISPTIGRVETFDRVKDGFDYPTDPTLSPSLSVPSIIGVKDIRTIDYIGIITGGRRYNTPPKLIVKDDSNGIELSSNIAGGSIVSVDVIKNSTSISSPLEIISIHNSNGYEIDTISVLGNLVTLELTNNAASNTPFIPSGFGENTYLYPFSIGDQIFIENCRLTSTTSGLANFNSVSYNYAFFDVVGVSTANNTVTYNMAGISTGSFGTYDDDFNLGVVINKKDMPVFEMILKDDVNYASNEKISSSKFSGVVMENGWDNKLNQMRLKNISGEITVGDKIFGETSKINGTVEYFDIFNLYSTLGVSRDKTSAIDFSSGILNEYSQRISDNFYYQKFSYSIRGNIPYNVWRESVRSIVHPSGFKEFSDLEIFTQPTLNEVNVGISKSTNMKPKLLDTDSSTFINVDSIVPLNVKTNFARVYEEEVGPDGSIQNIFFDGGIDLSPYIVNKTNKVIEIDDISNQFDGTSEQYLQGRFADASDLLDLNREFIQEEVVAFVEYNYPTIGLSTTYSQSKCKRDVGYIVDAISHDIKYNCNFKSIEAGIYYWNAGISYVNNEIEQTLFAYNYVKFISQYIINNQSPPTLYQSTVDQLFNFSLVPDPLNPNINRYKDSRNLILANKKEILDKSLASVAIGFSDFYFPGDAQTNARSRYYDGYRLIQQNRTEIIDTAWSNTLVVYPGISTTISKCKRDLGYFVDAISTDVFTGGNNYSRQFTLQYFNNGFPIANGLVGEEAESIYAFCQARDLMRSAVRNGLTIKDLTITAGPANYGIGSTVGITSTAACTDVQVNITTLVGIVTAVISAGSTAGLPTVNVGTYTTGGNKCYRDLGYIVDAIAQDLAYGTNQHIIYSTKKYFTGAGAALTTGLLGEESQSIYAFESAKGYIKKAITNQLNVKDLTITADPLTGFNTDPSSCANVQTNINTLVGILTVAIGSSSLSGIPTENYGTTDCADVRSAIGNYVGIITTIIGLGTNFAPTITYPSLTRGGSVVGLTTFKLTNKGTPLFKHEFSGSSIDIITNTFTITNHNFQSGQELIYTYSGGTPVGIATTSYASGSENLSTLLSVNNFDGTAVLENGYSVAISTTITGVSTVLSPVGPSTKQYVQCVGLTTTGTDAQFTVSINYNVSTGQPISTSILPTKGGSGYVLGQTVSIAGTYIGGTTPTNNLTFVISKTGPTVISGQANQSYSVVPSNDLSGATFNVSRDSSGAINYVAVVNGGSGYASTSVISIAGTYVGGSTSNDILRFRPLELGTRVLPKSVFVYKLNDNQFKLSGFSTSVFFDLTGVGTATHYLAYKEPNSSVIVTIDGIIQKALTRKSLNVSFASSVSTASTTIISISSGISSLRTRDIINIDDELVSIKNIGITSANQIEVVRGYFGSVATSHTVGASATVLNGNFNVVGDIIYFDTAPYGKIGPVGLKTGSTFSGRVFSRKFDPSTPNDKNILLDDISLSFTGIAATEFTVKSNGQNTNTLFNNINNITESSNNPIILINNVFQDPINDFTIDGSGTNVVKFLSGVPKAGKISKVAVSTSYGYVPRIGAAATVVVSAAGTISSVIVTGGGSGYRSSPVVSIASTIGTGASITATVSAAGTITGFVIVNAGTGYTTTSLPKVVIGIPTGYSNLSLGYTGGTSGVGQNAKLTVEVGMGSSIISYKFDQPGIGYKVGDKLTPIGIPTTSPLTRFVLTVEEVETDSFSGFYPGQFVKFDDISQFFNGFRKKFTLSTTVNGVKQILGLKVPTGTDLDITNNIFIYINDVLQIPNSSYKFSGSRVIFTEAPKPGSKCSILYYRGSSVDVELVIPPPTIKPGDKVIIQENPLDPFDISQFDRVVKKITSSDQLETFNYYSVGIITDPTKVRPLTWQKQINDTVISGTLYPKSRPSFQSNVRPSATVIKKIQPQDEVIYVDNAYPLFSDLDGLSEDIRDILILENKTIEPCLSEAVVSTSSTISSVNIIQSGVGYANTQSPAVVISETAIVTKDPIFNWTGGTGLSTSYDLKSIKYKNKFVAVGSSSIFVTSSDGINWQVGTVGFGQTSNFNSIEVVGVGTSNFLVSVGSLGQIIKATDYGTTISSWNQIPIQEDVVVLGIGAVGRVGSGYTGTFNQIAYSSVTDTWVAVGVAGSIFVGAGVATDSFVSRYSETLSDLNSVSFGAEYFVAVGNNGTIRTSNNGTIWESTSSPVVTNLNKIIYVNGKFIIVGDSGTVLRSINRNSYQFISNNLGSENIVNIYYNYGFYVAVTSLGEIYYSFNLSDWIYRTTSQMKDINDLIFVNSVGVDGRYVAIGAGATAIYSEPIYNRATAISTTNNGSVTSIQIVNPGFGYDINNPPPVLVEIDTYQTELVKSFKVEGDHGIIIGVTTYVSGTPGIGTTSPKISFTLKSEQYDNNTLGVGYSSLNIFGITNSQLSKGDYFVISDSNVTTGGDLVGITTLLGGMSNYPNSKIGIAKSFIDGVYIVEDVTTPSAGIVTVTCNFAPMVDNYVKVYSRGSSNTGIGTNNFYGRYSWAKIYDYQNRILGDPRTFEVFTDNGITGMSSSPKIIRTRSVISK